MGLQTVRESIEPLALWACRLARKVEPLALWACRLPTEIEPRESFVGLQTGQEGRTTPLALWACSHYVRR